MDHVIEDLQTDPTALAFCMELVENDYMGHHRDEEWFACPVCGSEVRVGSRGCSTCTADHGEEEEEEEAWEKGDPDPGLADIPAGHSNEDEDFDYDEFVATEFGGKQRNRLNPVWIAVALAVLLVLLFLLLAAPRA